MCERVSNRSWQGRLHFVPLIAKQHSIPHESYYRGKSFPISASPACAVEPLENAICTVSPHAVVTHPEVVPSVAVQHFSG